MKLPRSDPALNIEDVAVGEPGQLRRELLALALGSRDGHRETARQDLGLRGPMDRRGPTTRPTLVSCSVLDRPNVLSHNLKIDPIKPPNLSHARGSTGV